jgi:HEAT repeat protein
VSVAEDVVRNLRDVGVDVTDVWELVNGSVAYPAAVPVLLAALQEADPAEARLREGIVRALTIKQARPVAAPVIISEMRRQQMHGADAMELWPYANALAVVADDSVYDEVVALAMDRSLGRAREMLMRALGNMRSAAATDVLVSMLDDPDVDGHAVVALSKRRDAPPTAFDRHLDDPRTWVRKAARRGAEQAM